MQYLSISNWKQRICSFHRLKVWLPYLSTQKEVSSDTHWLLSPHQLSKLDITPSITHSSNPIETELVHSQKHSHLWSPTVHGIPRFYSPLTMEWDLTSSMSREVGRLIRHLRKGSQSQIKLTRHTKYSENDCPYKLELELNLRINICFQRV
jgi:hypothetical protein